MKSISTHLFFYYRCQVCPGAEGSADKIQAADICTGRLAGTGEADARHREGALQGTVQTGARRFRPGAHPVPRGVGGGDRAADTDTDGGESAVL